MRTVIVPTLNEEENIERLVRSIFRVLGTKDIHVLIVDDDSTDRTHEVVSELCNEFPGLHMIVRKGERGLGSAVRLGASHYRQSQVVVMDADMSHNPKYLPSMFDKLEQGFDVVVGSRYIPKGDIVGWLGSRIAISKVATAMARAVFRVPVSDPMSGFVGCRSGRLLEEGFDHADFKFLLEMLVKNRSLRVTEVPIVFHDRAKGTSKLGAITIALYIGLVLRLLFTKGRRPLS